MITSLLNDCITKRRWALHGFPLIYSATFLAPNPYAAMQLEKVQQQPFIGGG